MNLRKTIHLTGDQEIPGIPFLEYEPESLKHWVGVLKDIEICFYGNGLGIWDWSTPYFAQYRLNSEDPVKSKLVGFSREDWRRSQFK